MATAIRWGAVAVLVTAALTVAACGRGGGEAETDADSPLDGYLNEIYGEYDPDAPDPDRMRAEELVAACMADAGFEYYPQTEQSGVITLSEARNTLEFAEEFGYGYSTESNGPGTGTMNWPVMTESEAERLNSEYREALSEDAVYEYEAALYGAMVTDPPQEGEDIDWESMDRGCSGRGYDEIYPALAIAEQFTDLNEAMNQMLTDIEEDPRVAEALIGWSSCMATAGYPDLSQLIDAENLVNDLWNRFNAANGNRIDLSLGETDYDAVKASLPDELAELQAAEIAVAVADVTCRDEVGYTRIRQEVENEYEQAIVDTYRDDLEAWVAVAQAAEH